MADLKKIRILYVITSLQAAGAEKLVVGLACNLNKDKFETAIVSTSDLISDHLLKELKNNAVPLWYFKNGPGYDIRKHLFVDSIIRLYHPDIVHTHLSGLFFSLPAIFLRKIPVKIHTVHTYFKKDIRFNLHFIYSFCFKAGVIPVGVSEEVGESIGRFCKVGEQVVIPSGININMFQKPSVAREEWRKKEGFSQDDLILVSVARLSPEKNHRLLLRIFAEVSVFHSGAQLILAGEGNLLTSLKREAEKLKISAKVHFLGNRPDIPEILSAADIFVLFSDYEGRSFAVMEAMAAGKPVVITNGIEGADFLTNGVNGIVVPCDDIKASVKAVNSLIENPQLMVSIGRAASTFAVENFGVDKMVDKYESLYVASFKK